jgi:hypothetical protein
MTDLEDRLRDELSELAAVAQPDTIRPLRHLAPRRRTAAARILAPVAAMVAVAAVAIAGAVIARALPHRGAAPVPAGPELVRSGTVPRFYVLAYQSFVDGKEVTYAAVHSSATGRTLARVVLPSSFFQGGGWTYGPSITGAGNDRTFMVTNPYMTSVHNTVWLLRLQVSASGRSIQVTRLPLHVPPAAAVDDIALSPDGTRIAMTAQWGCGKQRCQYTGIRVVDLATGAVTAWSTRANGAPFNGSWVGDHAVAFEWQPSAHGQVAEYRVLPLSSAHADLLRASQPIPGPPTEPNSYVPRALVTPDGKTVITSEVEPVTHLLYRVTVARIVALNARTGRLERTLYTVTTQDQSEILDQECNVLSLGPGGQHPLVDCFSKLGALVDGQIVSLPGFPSPSSGGIADQRAIAW